MSCVFLGGSRRVTRLNDAIRKRLQEIVRRDLDVVVGDANGADRALQSQLSEWGYPRVTVYHVGVKPRNNVGSWPVHRVETPKGATGFAFYSAKDRIMAERADCGLMLWDGVSRGTLANVESLTQHGKPVALYVSPRKRFENLRSEADMKRLTGAGSIDQVDRSPERDRQASFELMPG
jgi:hypothetical protein